MNPTYYQRNRLRLLARAKQRYLNNKITILQQAKARWRTPGFKESRREYMRDYFQTDQGKRVSERIRERQRIASKTKQRWKSRKLYMQRYMRQYYEDNKDSILEGCHRYYLKNKAAYISRAMARRALIAEVTIDQRVIDEWKARLKASLSFRCYYCYKTFSTMEIHIDHIVPLSKKGPHAIGNLCASCPRCNLTKREKLISEWKRSGQQILSL